MQTPAFYLNPANNTGCRRTQTRRSGRGSSQVWVRLAFRDVLLGYDPTRKREDNDRGSLSSPKVGTGPRAGVSGTNYRCFSARR